MKFLYAIEIQVVVFEMDTITFQCQHILFTDASSVNAIYLIKT